MVRKIFGFCLALIFIVAALAYAQVLYLNGTIKDIRPAVFGDQSAVLIALKDRPETFVVRTVDAPKFGLLKPETAAAAPDKAKMAKELAAAKGWRVRMTVTMKPDTNAQEFAVQSLERLPGK